MEHSLQLVCIYAYCIKKVTNTWYRLLGGPLARYEASYRLLQPERGSTYWYWAQLQRHLHVSFFPFIINMLQQNLTCRIMLEFQFPKTFDGMCLFEPGLAPTFTPMEVFLTLPYLTSSNNRRDVWPNR